MGQTKILDSTVGHTSEINGNFELLADISGRAVVFTWISEPPYNLYDL